MTDFIPNQTVQIPCRIDPGAFAGEYLVLIKVEDGEISGFVQDQYLDKEKEDEGYITATIVDVTPDHIAVRIPGSFFTTTGLAWATPDWARSNWRRAEAA